MIADEDKTHVTLIDSVKNSKKKSGETGVYSS